MKIYLLLACIAAGCLCSVALAQENKNAGGEGLMELDFSAQKTVIEADALTLQAKKREFTYTGNVKVDHGDMKLTCQKLDGTYNETNEIDSLIATKNVYIEKGPTIKATGERAVFNSTGQTLTLSENPELIQQGSILSADEVIIYMQEDRSEAVGNVRVTIIDTAPAGGSQETPGTLSQSKGAKKSSGNKEKKKAGKKSK